MGVDLTVYLGIGFAIMMALTGVAFIVGVILLIVQITNNRIERLDGTPKNKKYNLYVIASILMASPFVVALLFMLTSILINMW